MGRARLTRAVLTRPALQVAPDLLGCLLEVDSAEGAVVVRITEVEAYEGTTDPASHAFGGRTVRTAVMFGPAGHLYVYFTYGLHHCLNVVCGPPDTAAAVLVRAGEVIDGVPVARYRRAAARRDSDLARGPARLAQATGLTTADGGADLLTRGSAVRLRGRASTLVNPPIRNGPRVGVSVAADRRWRFWLDDEPTVSSYRRSPRAAPPGMD